MKNNICFCLILLSLGMVAPTNPSIGGENDSQAQLSCEKSGGIDCKGCCKEPIIFNHAGSAATNCCSQQDSCIERMQSEAKFDVLGNVTIERFPKGNYGVWYGAKDAEFGNRNFADAENSGGSNFWFSADGREYSFLATENGCEISIGESPQEYLGLAYNFVFVPIDNSWNSQEGFKENARPNAEFFKDISQFRQKNTRLIYLPVEFANSRCDVSNISREKDSKKNFYNIKNCADLYTSSIGISYERAVGISSLNYRGKASFGYKTAYVASGFDTNRISTIAHELGHTYYLCDEYNYTLYTAQEKQLDGTAIGCANKWPEICPSSDPCSGEKCREDGLCPGNTPTFRDYSGPKLPGNYCKGEIHYSVMGALDRSECGYDITGGYEAIGGQAVA